ncbi:hypothetical protein Bbelb_337360 [Branchiostoma belcheri]|nr:hypothetical protein Bbelb_337360 [Branchiostoma belcheri]
MTTLEAYARSGKRRTHCTPKSTPKFHCTEVDPSSLSVFTVDDHKFKYGKTFEPAAREYTTAFVPESKLCLTGHRMTTPGRVATAVHTPTSMVIKQTHCNNLKRPGCFFSVLRQAARVCTYPRDSLPNPPHRPVSQERAATHATTGREGRKPDPGRVPWRAPRGTCPVKCVPFTVTHSGRAGLAVLIHLHDWISTDFAKSARRYAIHVFKVRFDTLQTWGLRYWQEGLAELGTQFSHKSVPDHKQASPFGNGSSDIDLGKSGDPEETGWCALEPTPGVKAGGSPTGALGRRTVGVCPRCVRGTAYGEDMSWERATTRPNRLTVVLLLLAGGIFPPNESEENTAHEVAMSTYDKTSKRDNKPASPRMPADVNCQECLRKNKRPALNYIRPIRAQKRRTGVTADQW